MEDRAKIWRAGALGNTLFLAANFRRQRFDRHFHEEFAIGVIESGCQAFAYDSGRRLDFTAGTIALIAPGVVHTGWSGAEDGWRYRMLYPSVEFVRPIVTDIFGDGGMPTFHTPRVTDAALAQLDATNQNHVANCDMTGQAKQPDNTS
ncbi:AraC family ligand binding domain-containing protein [Bosea sp. TAF32]|uniref:AraC family ligand binding domain-containing protein n=1 Tax=Bosea sp. TAF32 TaxID=3237482 RepID=UPI003F9081B8